MRSIVTCIFIGVSLFFFKACNPQPEATEVLKQAEHLMETNPDSAMQLIDSLFYPEKSLSHEDYMRFLVTQVQAKYKTYRPVSEDTLIFKARDYFSDLGKEHRMAALAWFYSGCVYREREEYEKAIEYYRTAGDYASKADDINLQGLVQYNMGDLLAEQGLYKEALKSYTEAERLYDAEPDKQTQCFSAIGRMHMLLQQPDSALRYFHKGLEIARAAEDKELQSLLAQNLSVAYTNIKQFDKAETYLDQSFLFNTDSTEIPRYYLNFAKLHAGMGQTDSATWYTEQLKQHVNEAGDDYFKASAYSYLAGWEKGQANFDAAFAYQEARMKTLNRIMEVRDNQSVYEANLKYDYGQMQKQYYKNLTVRQLWIIMLLVSVIAGGTLFTVYWIRQKNRRLETQRMMDTLQEMNRALESLLHQKQLDLRKDLLWRFDVTRKVLEMSKGITWLGKSVTGGTFWVERFNNILYGEKNIEEIWEVMFQTFNVARPGLAEKIRERYPDFTETEFRISILVYAGFSIKESALILDLSSNTIQTRRTDVRRKMGLDTRGDIAHHIDQL